MQTLHRTRAGVALALAALAGLTALLAACADAPPSAPANTTSAAAAPSAATPEVRRALAPTGTLRVAVYPGSPTSMVRGPGPDEMRGLTVEVGRALAERLGVPAEIVVFDRVAEVVAALKAGHVDLTITNATPERAADLDFTEALVALELGVLVRPGSPLRAVDAIDGAGLRIGVSQGSSSQRVLGPRLQRATLVAVASLPAAATLLKAGELDAFATNKGILHELADRVPGAQVLPGAWGQENLALAVPQGRAAGRGFLRAFATELRRSGLVQRAADRVGLRGLAAPKTE